MLYPCRLRQAIFHIRRTGGLNAKIFLHTAITRPAEHILSILWLIDGLCITLHDQSDIPGWEEFEYWVSGFPTIHDKSLRLNVFRGVDYNHDIRGSWLVKDNIEWIKDAPLPEGEFFMQMGKFT